MSRLADDGGPAIRSVAVIQGEVKVSAEPDVVLSTVLGSCIAVCMWDPGARVGGMNHFLLAEGGPGQGVKYGAHAMEMLINRLLRAGAARTALVCKVFGGAAVSRFSVDIGRRNADFARRFLADEGIPCLSESVGGTQARRVQFTPTTGAARMLLVKAVEADPIRPVPPPQAPDVTLF